MSTAHTLRRDRLAPLLPLENGLLVIGAGVPHPLPEISDQTYPFRAHAEYYYLTGLECPGAVVAYDPADGNWLCCVPQVTEAERVWEGRIQPPGEPIGKFDQWLSARRGRLIANLGAPVPGVVPDDALTSRVRESFTHARRAKDPEEIARLRRSAAATVAGYAVLPDLLRPGITERAVQIELEAAFFRHGADATGYHSIVGFGPDAAVLHFPPGNRIAREGDFVLIDAGAECDRYVTDVTRTYVVGQPDAWQRDLHQLVLGVEQSIIARCRPGAEWRDLHLTAAVDLTAGLVTMGIMRGNPETLVEREAHTLFFPHGLGHMVGLGVRDAGGLQPGRQRDPRPGLRTLRMDLPLAPGYVVTVEPGLYFISALLNDPARRERFADCVNWAAVEPLLDRGGVRIEDNVLVTAGEPEVLTAAIPKTL